jgi:hypothetical protein
MTNMWIQLRHRDYWYRHNMIVIGLVTLTLTLLSFMNDAVAMASVSLCNDGQVPMSVMVIDSYTPFGGNPEISGWYRLDPGDCYDKNGGKVEMLVGFFVTGDASNSYYDFDPPKIYKPGLDWVPAMDAIVERSSRKACVDPSKAFKRSGSRAELEQCPAGWVSVPFNWRVWVYSDEDRRVKLYVKPTPDKIKAADAPPIKP